MFIFEENKFFSGQFKAHFFSGNHQPRPLFISLCKCDFLVRLLTNSDLSCLVHIYNSTSLYSLFGLLVFGLYFPLNPYLDCFVTRQQKKKKDMQMICAKFRRWEGESRWSWLIFSFAFRVILNIVDPNKVTKQFGLDMVPVLFINILLLW